MMEILNQVLQIGFFAAMIRLAVPLLLGTVGELFSERAGILNLGIEGIITLSAIAGFLVAYQTGNLWLAVHIFDRPRRRSTKMIGVSPMRQPRRCASNSISTRNA